MFVILAFELGIVKFSDVRFIPPWLTIAKRILSGVSRSAISTSRPSKGTTNTGENTNLYHIPIALLIQGSYEVLVVEFVFLYLGLSWVAIQNQIKTNFVTCVGYKVTQLVIL